jgi:hypothetical protein
MHKGAPLSLLNPRYVISLVAVLGLVLASAVRLGTAWSQAKTTGSLPTGEKVITAYDMSEALQNVAAAYRTVIGLEEPSAPVKLSPPVAIHFDDLTLTEALNKVLAGQQHYAFRREPDGSFVVFRKGVTFSVANLALTHLEIRNLNRDEIEEYLETDSELTDWLREQGCARYPRVFSTSGSPPQDTALVNLDGGGKSLRENLNEIVRQLGTYYWTVTQTQKHGRQCRVGITLQPIIPEMRRTPARPQP